MSSTTVPIIQHMITMTSYLTTQGGNTGGVNGRLMASVSLLRRDLPGDETGEARCELDLSGGRGGTWLALSTLSSSSLSDAWSRSLTSWSPKSVSSRRALDFGDASNTDILRLGFSGMFREFADVVAVVGGCDGDVVDVVVEASLTIDVEKRLESGKDIGYRQKSRKKDSLNLMPRYEPMPAET